MLYPIENVRIFAGGLDHPEGVAVAYDGTVYAGGEAGQVYRISPDGRKVEIIANTGGFCLGLTLDQQDNLYICDCKRKAVLKLSTKGDVSVFVEAVGGRRLIQPNFGVFDSKGSLYFSDSGDWKKTNGVIYRAAPDGTASVFSPGPFHFANGLALDASEQYLYAVESNRNHVLRITMGPDGTALETEVYAAGLGCCPGWIGLRCPGQPLCDHVRFQRDLLGHPGPSRRRALPGCGERAALPGDELRLWRAQVRSAPGGKYSGSNICRYLI